MPVSASISVVSACGRHWPLGFWVGVDVKLYYRVGSRAKVCSRGASALLRARARFEFSFGLLLDFILEFILDLFLGLLKTKP